MKLLLDASVEFILKFANDEVRKKNHSILTAEHVLYVALLIYPVNRLFESLNVDIHDLRKKLQKEFLKIQINNDEEHNSPQPNTIQKSQSFMILMESAYINAVREEKSTVGIKDLLIAFIEVDRRNHTNFQFSQFFNINKMTHILRYDLARTKFLSEIDNDESLSDMEIEMFSSLYGEDEELENEELDYDEELKPNISLKLTTDLCAIAKSKGFDPFIGQENVLYKIYEVLLRKKQNNIILVGDPGVGKTAIIHEFANRLVANNVPEELQGHTLLNLDIISLVAGTRYRGDFEDRVKQLIDSLSNSKNNILFLDDIYSIISAGASAGNSNDFGDLIKPLLVDNMIRCIGAITFDEFKNFEKEKTLLRRFNIVEMNETNNEETLHILSSIKEHYEEFYDIHYSDSILQDIVYLSDRYISERHFPDKAIDILDAVGAMLRIRKYKTNTNSTKKKKTNNKINVSVLDIEEVITNISKRPINSIQKNELSNLKKLQSKLSKKIFGQTSAIETLSKVIIRSRAGLREQTKPIASLLFVGPTGVGKTELSKQLAQELGMNFQRFDMSEFQEKHTLSKFIGSPPGYVGHEQGGLLIDNIRRYPNSVLLLDEIEKAHSDVFNLLLQIMDYATISDSTGKKADFKNVILIMTSNAGAQESIKSVVGFEKTQVKGNREITTAITEIFSPEFRNRLDETLLFSPLTIKNMKAIIVKELHNISELLLLKNIKLEWNKNVVLYLVKKGFNIIYGARSVLRVIENEVKDKLAEVIIKQGYNNQQDKILLYLSMSKEAKKIDTNFLVENEVIVTHTHTHEEVL